MIPSINKIFKNPETNNHLRIIWHDSERGYLFYVRISQKGNCINGIEYCESILFNERFSEWEPVTIDPFFNDKPENEISETDLKIRDKRFKTIESIVTSIPDVFYPRLRGKLIKDVLKEQKEEQKKWESQTDKDPEQKKWHSRSRILAYMNMWWAGGQNKNALLSRYDNCGAKGIVRNPSKEKRGRPRIKKSSKEVNVDNHLRNKIEGSYYKYYCKNPHNSVRKAYESMIAFEFMDTKKIPSYKQFYYWGARSEKAIEAERLRAGDIVSKKDLRPLIGDARLMTFGPGSEAQIDCTKDNTHVVSLEIESPNQYIGRLTLYFVVDVFSGVILGVALLPENASYISACLALLNAASDKVEFCASLGIPITYADWPCDKMVGRILGDKGELFSKYADSITNNLHVVVENTPSYRPDLKSLVERAIGHFLHEISGLLYGYGLVTKAYPSRISRDTRKDAILNMNDILKIIVREILHYNKYHPLKDYPLTEGMIRDNIRRRPLDIWNWGITKGLGSLTKYEKVTLWRNLLPQQYKVSCSENGFYFKTKDWVVTCDEGRAIFNSLLANKKKATISYNPNDLDETFLYHEKKFFKLRLRQQNLPFSDFFELESTLQHYHEQDMVNEEEKLDDKARVLREQKQVLIEAEIRNKAFKNKVNVKNVLENKAKETARFRKTLKENKSMTDQLPTQPKEIKRRPGLPSFINDLKQINDAKIE